MADPQYDAYREFAGDREAPDPEPPESSEDRYRDVLNDEAERLPPEVADSIIDATACSECSEPFVPGAPYSFTCAGCDRDIHVSCRSLCERCDDYYCSRCLVGEMCSGCYDDLRAGEYSRGGATREV